MKLSVNVVHGGRYVRAGDDLPKDFVLPPHLEAFVIDEPLQTSRADLRLSSDDQGVCGTEARLAKPAMNYTESEEEFAPQWGKPKKHALKKKGKGRLMRLSCNLITNNGPGTPSVWYDAGQQIPDELVPDHAKQYRISEAEGRKLYNEILEWRAIVAERREKKEREAQEERAKAKREKARAK